MKKEIGIVVFFVVIILGVLFFVTIKRDEVIPVENSQGVIPSIQVTSEPDMKKISKPTMQIDKNKIYTVILNTSEGEIDIQLFAKSAPITVNNFVFLSKNNFYKNVIFHRVIKDFMIQGGDPTGTGSGGPGYKFDDEPFTGEYTRGTVAMANAGPNTNGSQFFILHKDYALSKIYVIFGKVTKGIDVVDKIAEALTGSNDRPINPVKILDVKIEEK
ncbi:MAG: peptidylprolyl isomerase [bacterium]|nr:peptidylprolyl isomerase [bacterium]